jgi:subtilase family serine protease
MKVINRLVALGLLLVVAACSGAGSVVPAGNARASGTAGHGRMRPAEGANALPGEGANALPGSQLLCAFSATPGQASCTIAIDLNVPAQPNPTTPSSLIPGLHPSDLASAYAMPSGGAGQTVAIVDAYDDPTAEADLAVYRNAFGLPACTSSNGCFRKVNQSGQSSSYPVVNTAWADEIGLDLDMVSAICPKCSIVLVEANSASIDDLGASVDTAAATGAKVVSNSYYTFEWSGETSEDAHYRHPGIAITVSSGDAAEPFYPAASPYVTSVGGTSLTGGPGAWNETPWKFGGTGCSAYEPRPRFQHSVSDCTTRSTVDVAAIADPQTGVATFETSAGGWVVAGGTSAGAPLVAAAYALAGNGEGPAYSYAHASGFRNIGSAGYSLTTGLGSPQGVGGL